MLRLLILGMLLCVATLSANAQKVLSSPIPEWVETPSLDTKAQRDNQIGEGYRYLLIERQINVSEQQAFYRYATQVLSPDGIREHSDLLIEYDPSFQVLEIHEVSIYREGQKIDKLDLADLKIIQKETSADRHIYDGALTALIHLSDVKKNDIIDYSYSIKGFNPVYGKNISGFLYHQLGVKVEKFHYRILVPQGQPLQLDLKGHSHQPEKEASNGNDVYEWSHQGLSPMLFDSNVPYWKAIYPMTSYSTFADWKSVVGWALPLYSYSEQGLDKIKGQIADGRENISRITDIIRYVQDDIRYLGLESGMSAYKPNSPQKVFEQKYGDCKDKSLLLVALLRKEGLEAYPVLVNTEWKDNVAAFSANASAFDHCIVTYKWKGQDYFVDPTISGQGGNLTNIFFPDYKKGLVLKPGNASLTDFPEVAKSVQKVEELLVVHDLEGKASLQIKTEYRGRRADEIRSSFLNSTVEEISKTYLDFYSAVFPGISASSPIEFSDSDRNVSNVVTTLETYEIDGFWVKSETEEDQLYAELYPLELNSRLGFPQTSSREADYFLGEPEEFSLVTKLVMPEPWPVENYHRLIDAGAFTYENEVSGKGNTIEIKHNYNLFKSSIPGSEVSQLIEKKKSVNNELSFYLTYAPNGGSTLDITAFLSAMALLAVFGFLAVRWYKSYNPEPEMASNYDTIGGWLILPTISLLITPIVLIYNMIESGYFDTAIWNGVKVYGTALYTYYLVSFVFLLFSFSYSILTAVFFFKLRSGAPLMYIVFMCSNFLSLMLEAYVSNQYFHDLGIESSSRDLIRSAIGLFIWIPYFVKSTRVKSTFTNIYKNSAVEMAVASNRALDDIRSSEDNG